MIGVLAGFSCAILVSGLLGGMRFGVAGGSTLFGILVGGAAQRWLLKRFMPKANQDD
jgi:hypothetical protein